MDEKDIFSRETEVGAQNTRQPKMIPKWAIVFTSIVLMIVILVSGIFIGLNINGVDLTVKQMNKKMPALDEIYALIDEYYYKEVDWNSVQDKSIAGMLALDQFSGVSIIEQTVPQPKMGITFTFSYYNDTFVFNISKQSPAYSARGTEKNVDINYKNKSITVTDIVDASRDINIERGDQLIGVKPSGASYNYNYILGMNSQMVQNILISANTLDLLFLKPDDTAYSVIIQKTLFVDSTSTAEYYNMGDVSGNTSYENVGYVSLSEYDVSRVDEFILALTKFKTDSRANKLILDLRNNGGGDVEMVQRIAPYLMDVSANTPLMQFVDKKGNVDTVRPINHEYENQKPKYIGSYKTDYQIVVLTNDNTASASEATLGLLRYYEPTTYAIGIPTYGKGVAQAVIPNVAGKYLVAIVTATFNLPVKDSASGWKNFHGEGMVPDYNFYDEDKIYDDYGRIYAKLTDEIEVKKALEYLTK